jgi:AcrR family transcriptional regulator
MTVASVEVEPASRQARARLVAGLAEAIKERGYRETKIGDIVAKARTSRRTFYEVFDSKDECFLALMHDLSRKLVAHIAASVDPTAPWDEQVRAGVTAWIEAMASEPEISISWIRELPSLGPIAAKGQRDTMQELAAMLHALSDTPQMRAVGIAPTSFAQAMILLGGLRELSAAVVEGGGDIREITDDAVDAALSLLGPGATSGRQRRR